MVQGRRRDIGLGALGWCRLLRSATKRRRCEAKKEFLEIDQADQRTTRRFKQIYVEIYRMIRVKARFSGEMHSLLQGQRSPDHPWIENVLSAGG